MTNVSSIHAHDADQGTVLDHVIGEVRAHMARQRLSSSELARMTGTKQPYWSRRLTGVTAFDVNDLAILAYVLKVPVSTFIPAIVPDGFPPAGQGKGPAGGAARPSLPELDSNQQPAGFEFRRGGEVIPVRFGERTDADGRSRGTAVVTPFLSRQAS
jgi:transcriptional regulator with XRE-family HTH domain